MLNVKRTLHKLRFFSSAHTDTVSMRSWVELTCTQADALHLPDASVLAWLDHHWSSKHLMTTFELPFTDDTWNTLGVLIAKYLSCSWDTLDVEYKQWQKCAAAYLVSGSGDRLGEGKERQGQVHEAVLVWLELFVSLDNLEELQAHQTHHRSRGRGDGWNDLASYQFALDWIVTSASIMREKKDTVHYYLNKLKQIAEKMFDLIHCFP